VIRFAADENFNNDLLRALLRRKPDLNIVRVQDTQLYMSSDPDLLAWTAQEQRILLTHDVQTLPNFAYQRVKAGLPMPGVIEVNWPIPIGEAVEDLLILIEATHDDEWEGQIKFVPIR
jgi:hypothetical protein